MRKSKTLSLLRAVALAAVAAWPLSAWVAPAATAAEETHYYVSTTGSDSNAGTSPLSPWRTIGKAGSTVTAGAVVHVAPGTYMENGILLRNSGTASSPIRYVSDTKWGAKIQSLSSYSVVRNDGDYVTIDGFEVIGDSGSCLGIVNYGGNTSMINNHVHHIPANPAVCGSSGGAGINDANYAKSNADIIGNVVHDVGPWPTLDNRVQGIYHSNFGGRIMNNIAFHNTGFGIHLWHAATDTIISNNVSFKNGNGGIIFGAGDSPGGIVNDNMVVTNNISVNNGGIGIREYAYTPDAVGEHNVIMNNIVTNNPTNIQTIKAAASGNLNVDPEFVNYTGDRNGDYRLKESSPGIDGGISLGAPAFDYAQSPRPAGAGVDIGAYEFSPDTLAVSVVNKNLKIGDSTQVISPNDLSGAQYVSDNPSVATVDGSGLVTALSNGEANITVTTGNGMSGTIPVSVAARLQTVTLQTNDPSAEPAQTQQFFVTGVMSDGSQADLSSSAIRYAMDNFTVAVVDPTGKVTGKKAGTALLSVEVTLDGVTKTASRVVTIDPPSLGSVTLSYSRDPLIKGQTSQINVTGYSKNGKPTSLQTASIAYRSSNPGIATVNATGLVTAVAPGTADITADVSLSGDTASSTRTISVQPGLSVLYKFQQLPVVSKTVPTILYAPTLQLEATTPGPSITFALDVPEAHYYEFKLRTFKATSYGNYSIKIDGNPLAEYQFYGTTGAGTTFDSIGAASLTAGVHELTFENIGKLPQATNYKMGVIELELLAQDTTPPATRAIVSPASPDGANGWYTSDVTLSFAATDQGSGLAKTEYRINDGDWVTYTGSIPVFTDGIYTVEYRSTDHEGLVEPIQTAVFKIDRTAPILTVQLDKTTIWPPNHQMIVVHASLDSSDAGSGVASVILTSITSNEPDSGLGDIQANIGSSDDTFLLRAERLGSGSGRMYTITYMATDYAGNQTDYTLTVTVPHDQSEE